MSTGRRALAIEVDTAAVPPDLEYPSGLGFDVVAMPVSTGPAGITRLILTESGDTGDPVFTALAENLIELLEGAEEQNNAITRFVQRLIRWQTFMRKDRGEGLSLNERIGLFGELIIIREFFITSGYPAIGINSWKGFEQAKHDFQTQFGNLEVKTTSANTPSGFHVSNIAQLDSAQNSPLYLGFVETEVSANGHETLSDIIDSIRTRLDPTSLIEFNDGLIEYGYIDAHADRYQDQKFTFRRLRYYEVTADFPKIQRDTLTNGVERVRYEVAISACGDFKVPAETVAACLLEATAE